MKPGILAATFVLACAFSTDVSARERSGERNNVSPLKEMTDYVIQHWQIVEQHREGEMMFEKRASKPRRQLGMCIRTFLEIEYDATDLAANDDAAESLRTYRMYAFPEASQCSDLLDPYTFFQFKDVAIAEAIVVARRINSKEWITSDSTGTKTEVEFDASISDEQKKCLLDGRAELGVREFKASRIGNVISGTATTHSCSGETEQVIINFSEGDNAELRFRSAPRKMIEG